MKGARLYADVLFVIFIAGLVLTVVFTAVDISTGKQDLDKLFAGSRNVEIGALPKFALMVMGAAAPIALLSLAATERNKLTAALVAIILIAITLSITVKV